MKNRFFALLCALVLLVSAVPAASALEGEASRAADTLSGSGGDGAHQQDQSAQQGEKAVFHGDTSEF